MALKFRTLRTLTVAGTVLIFLSCVLLVQLWSGTSPEHVRTSAPVGNPLTGKRAPSIYTNSTSTHTTNPTNPDTTATKTTVPFRPNRPTNVPSTPRILPKLSALHALNFYSTTQRNETFPTQPWRVGANFKDGTVRITDAHVYNSKRFAAISGYKIMTPDSFDAYRGYSTPPLSFRKSAMQGRHPWLIEMRNVWMTETGDVIVPRGGGRAATYSLGGGFVEAHWPRLKGRRVTLTRSCQHPVAFALLQNHGYSYYHVMDEQLPRMLSFLPAVREVLRTPSGRIVIPRSAVLDGMFRFFSVPREKWASVRGSTPCFFGRVFIPEPLVQGRYPPRHMLQRATYAIVRGALNLKLQPPLPRDWVARRALVASRGVPLMVLIERATRRSGSRCFQTRCIGNFGALRDGLRKGLGDSARLVVLSPGRDVLARSVRLFSEATVVVGAHGAAFANVPHMRGPGTYALHLGWRGSRFYESSAKTFGVEFVNIVTLGMSQHGRRAWADVPKVVGEVRNVLRREGFKLPHWIGSIQTHFQFGSGFFVL